MKQMCCLWGCHQPESPASHPLHLLGHSMYTVLLWRPPLLRTIQCLDRLIMVLFAFVTYCEPTHLLCLIFQHVTVLFTFLSYESPKCSYIVQSFNLSSCFCIYICLLLAITIVEIAQSVPKMSQCAVLVSTIV